tara:strand:- start:23016 stop:23219 length:204 start_codon:yes stop_codon:yes gene_type:complete
MSPFSSRCQDSFSENDDEASTDVELTTGEKTVFAPESLAVLAKDGFVRIESKVNSIKKFLLVVIIIP